MNLGKRFVYFVLKVLKLRCLLVKVRIERRLKICLQCVDYMNPGERFV